MSRYATRYNKRDANENELLQCLARLGIIWLEAPPLDGWCWLGQWVPVEIKVPRGNFTKGQRDFIAYCKATGKPCLVWRSEQDVLDSAQRLGFNEKPAIRVAI
jgi:hypothetical protein